MSAIVHGLALTVALGLMAQVKPVVPEDTFTWDVALIEPQRTHEASQAETKPTEEPEKPTPHPAAPTPSQPKRVMREVQPREVTPVVQRESRQPVETNQPIQQTMAAQPSAEAVTPVMEQQPQEVQQTEQSVDESVTPVVQQEAATQPSITEAHAIETNPVTHDPDLSAPPSPATPAQSDAAPVAKESAPQIAMASSPTPAVKADYGWLAESLRRRLAQIKRYPSTARLNGWEGKVVLRAVIRADGQLSEVKVHRSSGHEALDNAAMEAIRLVCPLHMTNTIAAAEIAVLVPMVYSLGS
ncbi:MAG: TonB family protein [Nitrospira sp.]|nr:TonB family protein [Nitrospira sp.]